MDGDGFGVLIVALNAGEFEVGEHLNVRYSDGFYTAEVLEVAFDVTLVPPADRVTLVLTGVLPFEPGSVAS